MYWEHHPLSFVSGPSYTRKQSYISACRIYKGRPRARRRLCGGRLSLSLSLLSFSLRWLKLEEGRGRDRESVRPPTSRRNGKRQEEESGSKSGDARSRPDRSGRARTEIQPEACDLWKHGGIFIRVHRVHSVGLYLPSSLLLPPLQLLEFLPLKLDGVYHDPGRKRTLHHPYATKTTYESLSPPWVLSTYLIPRTTATPSLNRNGNVGGSRRPDTHPSPSFIMHR